MQEKCPLSGDEGREFCPLRGEKTAYFRKDKRKFRLKTVRGGGFVIIDKMPGGDCWALSFLTVDNFDI